MNCKCVQFKFSKICLYIYWLLILFYCLLYSIINVSGLIGIDEQYDINSKPNFILSGNKIQILNYQVKNENSKTYFDLPGK